MMRRRTSRAAVALWAAAATGAIALSVSAAAAADVQVHIKNLACSPANFTAHVGDPVEWINGDFVAHTATARNGDWDVNIPPNATQRLVVKRAGAVAYYCRFHPNMTAEIKISAQTAK